jgi:putative colanic acid biosynthesis acetyltransferase WcaF
MNINDYTPVQENPFSFSVKLKAKIWALINSSIFLYSPFFARKFRVFLIKMFGGNVDYSCSISRRAKIDYPWNLSMGYQSSISDNSWIYCMDKITIGKKCCISKNVFILTGAHSVNSRNFDLITKPVYIGDGVWVSTRATILPGIKLSNYTVIGANSVVTRDTEEFDILAGNPAKLIKKRNIIVNE